MSFYLLLLLLTVRQLHIVFVCNQCLLKLLLLLCLFFSMKICWNQKISADFIYTSVKLFNVWTGMVMICKVTRPRDETGDILVIQTLKIETRVETQVV